jgi:acyl carrier protein
MNRSELTAAVTRCLAEVLKRDLPDVTEETRLFDDLHLDSTTVLELLMALEESADVEFDVEELNMDDFRTVGTLADSVEAARANAPATAG